MADINCLPECITIPECAEFATPGWKAFWVIPINQVTGYRFEQVLHNPRGRVIGFEFSKPDPDAKIILGEQILEGSQFDFTKEGKLYTHTVQVVFDYRDSILRNAQEAYNRKQQYVIIGQDTSDVFWTVVVRSQGFSFTEHTGEFGRLQADNSLSRMTFTANSKDAPIEFLALDPANPNADAEQRLDYTLAYLNSLVDCGVACQCELITEGVADAFTTSVEIDSAAGGTETRNAEIEFSEDTCPTDDLELIVLHNPLPDGITIENPVFTDGTPNTFAFDVTVPIGATPGTYAVELQVRSENGCNASFVQNVVITAT